MEYFSQIFEKLATLWFDLNFTPIQKRALLAMSAVVVVLSIFIVIRGNTDEITPPPVVVEQVQAPQIFVDVTGAVNTPGVYTLTASSRVIDAIKAAGGSAPGADLSTINLARVLADGEQIYVDAAVQIAKVCESAQPSVAVQLTSTAQQLVILIHLMELGQSLLIE